MTSADVMISSQPAQKKEKQRNRLRDTRQNPTLSGEEKITAKLGSVKM
jgi:hypothetical protein